MKADLKVVRGEGLGASGHWAAYLAASERSMERPRLAKRSAYDTYPRHAGAAFCAAFFVVMSVGVVAMLIMGS